MIVFPQQSAEKTTGIQIGLDIEQVKKNHQNPQRKIGQPICEGIVFFPFLLSRGRINHRP
jgi:hypothetical protein